VLDTNSFDLKSEGMRVHFGLSNFLGMLKKRNNLMLFVSWSLNRM